MRAEECSLLLASPGKKKQDKVKKGHFQSERNLECVFFYWWLGDDALIIHWYALEFWSNNYKRLGIMFCFLRRRRTERMWIVSIKYLCSLVFDCYCCTFRLDMCRREFVSDDCNRGTAGKLRHPNYWLHAFKYLLCRLTLNEFPPHQKRMLKLLRAVTQLSASVSNDVIYAQMTP